MRRAHIGRVALSLKVIPIVLPVRYTVHNGELLLAVPDDQVAQALHGTIVAFQVDGVEEGSGQRWSVFAVGPVRRLEDFEAPGLGASPSAAPGAASPPQGDLFCLTPEILSGRWVETL